MVYFLYDIISYITHIIDYPGLAESIGDAETAELYAIQFLLINQTRWLITDKFGDILSEDKTNEFRDTIKHFWLYYVAKVRSTKSIQYSDSLILMYLCCIRTSLPVSLYDIYTWTCDGQLPYLGVYEQLPKAVRKHLNEIVCRFSRSLEPLKDLRRRVKELRRTLKLQLTFPIWLFIVRFTRVLELPQQVSEGATQTVCRLLTLLRLSVDDLDENIVLALLFVAVKLSLLDNSPNTLDINWIRRTLSNINSRKSSHIPHYST